ncbi:Monooxygenase, FAD-binding [Penicillium expansum]|uniref:Monooxygenase, FAD-binding n=1 Tax=Penicillium expansum TaxID=27334 RepID=A0A0A2JLP9_PENEN|nr:Monooxygenase, FAD-binding [Penicillium expansum]KGO40051.1 Monooxygenase, FAD-binding [Penicillium expansum]KGO53185.1 Monooxygenase, FAD-binding [Penicillium expansum]KGO59297.1 Monooxygenase, FAD-binding [Penicillium expansum]
MVSNGQVNGHVSQASLKIPRYPSNCLEFLNDPLSCEKTLPSKVRLNIIVVGAGLGGLATAIALASSGHAVTVYEQAQKLGEVGAGIQIPSNSTRLLSRLGLDPYLKEYVTEPEFISFRRWQSGDVIGLTRLIPSFQERFGAPYYVIHRANFHSALHQRALDLGVTVKVASRVVGYNVEEPSIVLENGENASADLIVAADGVKSVARGIFDQSGKPSFEKTGFAAYRATVDVERIKEDPELSWLLEKPALNIWVGDQRHVMTYTIGAGKSFNMVLSHPDDSDPSTWDQQNTLGDMRREFQGWDSRLEKIIGLIEKTIKWPLISGVPLSRWMNGKVLLLGDAAHAMLPYMSQGAAMAVEDGAALARSLSKIENTADIPKALSIFEQVRIERAGMMQEASLLNGKLWHFADGPTQEARDVAMKPETLGLPFSHSPNQWSDPATQMWCYGYDAEKEIDRAWKKSEL